MSQDNNWQQQVWQQPAAPQQPVAPAAPYGYAVQPPKKSRGWIVALVAVVLVFALLALGMWSCTSVMSSSFGSFGTGSTVDDVDYLTGDAVGVIDIDGTIQYDNTTSSPEGLKAQLDRAERTGKPVVVSSASVNASAAYEISSQADYIYTAKTTAIGAIGTVMQVTDLSGLMEKLGISVDNVTSADSKDSSYGTRPLTEEERAYYQDQVDQINETFIQTVAEGRDMPVEDVRALATGLTFTGMTAVENGLADEIGTKDDAVAKAAELANIAHYTTVTLKNPTSSLSSLLDLMSKSNVSTDDIARALKELDTDGSIAQ